MRSCPDLPPVILVLILVLACKQLNCHKLQYSTLLSYVSVNSEDPCSAGYEGIFMIYFRTELIRVAPLID